MARPGSGLRALAILGALTAAVTSAWAAPLRLAVVAPAPEHLAWDSARALERAAAGRGLALSVEQAAEARSTLSLIHI